jgi:hypothetical protein
MKKYRKTIGLEEIYYQVIVQDMHLLVLSILLCSNGFRPGVAVARCVLISLEESV